jgi:hypothetical protein
VLAHEVLGVQVGDVEVLELWTEPVLQVRLGRLGDPAQVAQCPPGLAGHLWQLIGAEN